MRILIVIPVYIEEKRHVEMLRVQSLIKLRLQKAAKNQATFYSAAVCDCVFEEHRDELESLKHQFDFWVEPNETVKHAGFTSIEGIRRPTNFAIDELARQMAPDPNLFILRIIQDTFIFDSDLLWQNLLTAATKRSCDKSLIGSIQLGTCNWHTAICEELGIPYMQRFEHIQGALMFARFSVWEHYYLGLPAQITHALDDVMMSLWIKNDGGTLWNICPTSFRHLHHCEPEVAQQIYTAHWNDL